MIRFYSELSPGEDLDTVKRDTSLDHTLTEARIFPLFFYKEGSPAGRADTVTTNFIQVICSLP